MVRLSFVLVTSGQITATTYSKSKHTNPKPDCLPRFRAAASSKLVEVLPSAKKRQKQSAALSEMHRLDGLKEAEAPTPPHAELRGNERFAGVTTGFRTIRRTIFPCRRLGTLCRLRKESSACLGSGLPWVRGNRVLSSESAIAYHQFRFSSSSNT